MASAAAGALRTAAIVVALVAALSFMPSSHGHQKKPARPLCSNCTALCNSNCSTVVAAECSAYCDLGPSNDCLRCRSQVQQGCQTCCSANGNGTTTSDAATSCCGNGCVGDCATCGCDCTAIVDRGCEFPCRPYYPYNIQACWGCSSNAGQQCFTACNATCYDNCVEKKDKGC
ncbi:hypothetical protein BS78_02G023300 [Paspalum vaginatum]|nr:hypothetical protein BS78_02G023300 [Paspalum vaginatum]